MSFPSVIGLVAEHAGDKTICSTQAKRASAKRDCGGSPLSEGYWNGEPCIWIAPAMIFLKAKKQRSLPLAALVKSCSRIHFLGGKIHELVPTKATCTRRLTFTTTNPSITNFPKCWDSDDLKGARGTGLILPADPAPQTTSWGLTFEKRNKMFATWGTTRRDNFHGHGWLETVLT
jgi:hypothetical protein